MYFSRIALQTAMLLACVLLLCLQPFHAKAAKKQLYSVNACNFSPYPVDVYSAMKATGTAYKYLSAAVLPGHCITVQELGSGSVPVDVHFYAEPSTSEVMDFLKSESWYVNAWGDGPKWDGGEEGVYFCAKKSASQAQRYAGKPDTCLPDEFERVYQPSIKFYKNDVDWWLLDSAICDQATDIDRCSSATFDDLSRWSQDMYSVLQRLAFVKNPPRRAEGVFPFATGIGVSDTNGAFNLGVDVVRAITETPFGTPVYLQAGDRIVSFDGAPVYGQDLVKLVYDQGKKYGYNHVHDVDFIRDGEHYKTQIGLFFDARVYGNIFLDAYGSCKKSGISMVLAAIDEFTFYTQNTIGCLTQGFRKEPSDFKQCKFERDQILAAYRQFCRQDYYLGEMLGGITYPFRASIEKVFIKNVPALAGKNILSRATRAAILEALEEGFRAWRTAPPGASSEYKFYLMKERAKLQGIMGVGFQISPGITGIAVAPLIFDTYHNLK